MDQALLDPYIFATLPCRYKTIWVMCWSSNPSWLSLFIMGVNWEVMIIYTVYHNKLLLGYFPSSKFKQSFLTLNYSLVYTYTLLFRAFFYYWRSRAPPGDMDFWFWGLGHLSPVLQLTEDSLPCLDQIPVPFLVWLDLIFFPILFYAV